MSNISKFLMHITTEENCDNIVMTKRFNASKHGYKKNLWLGDGVYFWDGNEDISFKLGKSLVKNKKGNQLMKTKRILLFINVEEEHYLNLDSMEWEETFEKFLRRAFPEGKQLLKMLKMYRTKGKDISEFSNNQIGKVFGSAINLFLEILEKEKGIQIDLVSHYFCHGYKKRLLFAREYIEIRQYCVKNLDLINGNSETWNIDYI